jgi:hypothetical protein
MAVRLSALRTGRSLLHRIRIRILTVVQVSICELSWMWRQYVPPKRRYPQTFRSLRFVCRIFLKTLYHMNRCQNVETISIRRTAAGGAWSKEPLRIQIHFLHFNNDSDLNTEKILQWTHNIPQEGTLPLRDVTPWRKATCSLPSLYIHSQTGLDSKNYSPAFRNLFV